MSRHPQSRSQSGRYPLVPAASTPAKKPPHASLGFAAVRLAIQARGPDGPIQFLDLCLHEDWQPNSTGFTLHLTGSDATWASGTSDGSDILILLGCPSDGMPRRYIAVSPERDDAFQKLQDSSFDDNDEGQNRPTKRPRHETSPSFSASKRHCLNLADDLTDQPGHHGSEDADTIRKRVEDSKNYIVEIGLVRLYPHCEHDSPVPTPSRPAPPSLFLRIYSCRTAISDVLESWASSRRIQALILMGGTLCVIIFVAVVFVSHVDI
ncbi:hypothetical protein LY78DRAFT_686736 [Colletotrichum sublineola]|nr:hypothetical protein LY78DRAFT_686736 [Colletotrichum sublineola]